MIVPPDGSRTDQVTAGDCPAERFVTLAENVIAPPGATDAGSGEIVTAIEGGGVTVNVEVSVLEGSATLVATAWYVPGSWGAV